MMKSDAVHNNKEFSRDMIMRHSYSMAIVRLINGLVDVNQTRGHAQPISVIAASMDIPVRDSMHYIS